MENDVWMAIIIFLNFFERWVGCEGRRWRRGYLGLERAIVYLDTRFCYLPLVPRVNSNVSGTNPATS
jgi:hypothetical protein